MNAGTAQQYARWIGALYIITIVAGGWGESHVPNMLLIANDLTGTAQRVASSVGLFRASFAAFLLEAACDITLNVLLYALLRPVSRNLALLATCFGLMGTAVFAAGEMLYFAAALPAVDADVARVLLPEAKAALTDPCQIEVPVLTIALDAGFQSIGPFNRAFKAATNLTPTEFRRLAMAGNAAPVNDRLKIGQSS